MSDNADRARGEIEELLAAFVALDEAEKEMLSPNRGAEYDYGYIREARLDRRNAAAAAFSKAFDAAVRSVPK